MKKLATDIDDFEIIIKNNYLYVDKTEFLAKIIDSGTYYFLSRPRRFGNTLFLDTIEKFYQGKRIFLRISSSMIRIGAGKSIRLLGLILTA